MLNNKIKIFLILLCFSLVVKSVFSININDCGVFNQTGVFNLTSDLYFNQSNSSICLSFLYSPISLVGNGFSIYDISNTPATSGIYLADGKNSSIDNISIYGFQTGIVATYLDYANMTNIYTEIKGFDNFGYLNHTLFENVIFNGSNDSYTIFTYINTLSSFKNIYFKNKLILFSNFSNNFFENTTFVGDVLFNETYAPPINNVFVNAKFNTIELNFTQNYGMLLTQAYSLNLSLGYVSYGHLGIYDFSANNSTFEGYFKYPSYANDSKIRIVKFNSTWVMDPPEVVYAVDSVNDIINFNITEPNGIYAIVEQQISATYNEGIATFELNQSNVTSVWVVINNIFTIFLDFISGGLWKKDVLINESWSEVGTVVFYANNTLNELFASDPLNYNITEVCLLPYQGMFLNRNTTLCYGMYDNTNIITNVSDITLDCNGSILIGPGYNTAIFVKHNNVVVKNCEILNYTQGIFVNGSNSTIINNSVHHNLEEGIKIFADVENNTIINNTVYNNKIGISVGE